MARVEALVLRLACALALALALATPAVGQGPARLDTLRIDAIVYHFEAGDDRLARRLATLTREAPPLPALPASVLSDAPVHVYLAPDERAFRELSGGSPPEWGAGIAVLGDSAEHIVLPGWATERVTPAQLPRVLRHELAHVALHRFLPDARVPRWFHEGYSRWAAGELDFEAEWQLRVAFALGDVPPLDSLGLDWPAGRIDAGVAYLLSASAIDYLVAEAGVAGLERMLGRWRESGNLDEAMRVTYGVTVSQFEEDWRKHVRSRYGWALVLSNSAIFWAFGGVLLVGLFLRRRRRDHARLTRMTATDPPDSPDWWNDPMQNPGDPPPPPQSPAPAPAPPPPP